MTLPPLPELDFSLEDAWPAPDYRRGQKRIFREAATALFGDYDIDTVIIDAPTGIGKSVINTGLCNCIGQSFMTTPQTALRQQLEDDELLAENYSVLRARSDYTCHEVDGSHDCSTCPIHLSDDQSCIGKEGCEYWLAKEAAMESPTATTTFAYLMVDGYLPTLTSTTDEEGRPREVQVSFDDRGLLVIDEGHTLEGQIASLFAGFSIGGNHLPEIIREEVLQVVEEAVPNSVLSAAGSGTVTASIRDHVVSQRLVDSLFEAADVAERHADQVSDELEAHWENLVWRIVQPSGDFEITLEDAMLDYQKYGDKIRSVYDDFNRHRYEQRTTASERVDALLEPDGVDRNVNLCEDLQSFADRVTLYLDEDYDQEEHPWLVEAEKNFGEYKFTFKPVHVDHILKENIWSRAEKVVISSATVPALGELDQKIGAKKWAERLGRDTEKTHVITAPSPFPAENRPIRPGYIDSMSRDGFAENIDDIVQRIRELADRHRGERGLIHCSSYDQVKALSDLSDIAILHSVDETPAEVIDRWEATCDEYPILISPSLKEGVDLKDDRCRWQAVVKIPWPSLGDARVRYRKDELGETGWYIDQAALKIVQAAGRGVRHEEDRCTMYILDSDFKRIRQHTPGWFQDAIIDAE